MRKKIHQSRILYSGKPSFKNGCKIKAFSNFIRLNIDVGVETEVGTDIVAGGGGL